MQSGDEAGMHLNVKGSSPSLKVFSAHLLINLLNLLRLVEHLQCKRNELNMIPAKLPTARCCIGSVCYLHKENHLSRGDGRATLN